jgi:signal transduction histidine kinase/ActR/RegA family two-component response regulator
MAALRTGKPMTDVIMGLGQRAPDRWVSASSQPLFREGETTAWAAVTTFSDVTEQRARQRELEQATAQAQAAGRAKSEFLATMSHELRTPMNGVIGLTDLMLNDPAHPLDSVQHETMTAIKDSGRMLLTVINDVLDYSKIEAGGRTFAREVIDPMAKVSDVVRVLSQEATRRGLRLEVSQGTACLAMGDAEAVRQVLFNLVGNALKFTEHGSVRVDLCLESGGVRISVRDTGIGIRPEHLPRLFQRFSQAESTTSRRFGGTGLGLAISQRLVEGMGSTIAVESEPDVGTCMHFTLPLAPPDARLRAPLRESNHEAERSLHVLLAEDNLINQRVASGMLRRLGHSPSLASDGLDAVHQYQLGRFDLILMDLHMPSIDGLEATRRIRAHEAAKGLPRTPIVALTASAMNEERAACLLAGMDDVLSKPLTLEALSKHLLALAKI